MPSRGFSNLNFNFQNSVKWIPAYLRRICHGRTNNKVYLNPVKPGTDMFRLKLYFAPVYSFDFSPGLFSVLKIACINTAGRYEIKGLVNTFRGTN